MTMGRSIEHIKRRTNLRRVINWTKHHRMLDYITRQTRGWLEPYGEKLAVFGPGGKSVDLDPFGPFMDPSGFTDFAIRQCYRVPLPPEGDGR